MAPDQPNIDAKITEILDKLQVISKRSRDDIDQLKDLREQYDRCMKNAPVRTRMDRCNELFKKATSLKREHDEMVAEQKKLMDDLHELRQKKKRYWKRLSSTENGSREAIMSDEGPGHERQGGKPGPVIARPDRSEHVWLLSIGPPCTLRKRYKKCLMAKAFRSRVRELFGQKMVIMQPTHCAGKRFDL